MVGLAGEGQNFDGNGMYVRFQPGGGDQTRLAGRSSGGIADKLFANAIRQAAGHAARLPGQAPALQARRALLQEHAAQPQRRRRRGRPTAAARDAGEPAAGGARAMRTAIRKHARDFAFVLGLVLVALLVGGYILSNQRFYLPNWVPVVGSDFVDYKAQFSTAQSVTPGQGQTVQVAGVDVGDITKVDLVDGRAVVTMKIRRKYTPIYKNATALLRPKTGLNDMVIELDPGLADGGQGARRAGPSRSTRRCPTSTSTRSSSSLDTDTRNYLQLLVGAAGEGLDGQGKALSADAQALRADRPLPGQAQRRAGRARRATSAARSTTSACSRRRWAPRTTTWPRWSTPPTASSRRSPTRTPTCARRCRSCPARCDATNTTLAKVDQAGQRARADARRPAARRPRARAGAGRRRGPFLRRDDADHPEPAAALRARRRCRWSRSCGPPRATSRWSRRS